MKSHLVRLIMMLQHLSTVLAVFERLEYERISVSTDYQDIACGLQALDQYRSRGSSFEVNNQTCDTLPESWFDSQPSIPGSTIFILIKGEPIFEPEMNVYTDIVPTLVVGSSFVYDIRTGVSDVSKYQPYDRWDVDSFMTIDVERDSNLICFHFDMRFMDRSVRFNSYHNNWGSEIKLVSPLVLNSGYQLEVKHSVTALEVHINGSLFYAFKHRTSFADCDVIHCTTDVGLCMGLQFVYQV